MGFNIQYLYPFWGCEGLASSEFFERVSSNGFDGIEINLPDEATFLHDFEEDLDSARSTNADFYFMAQQVMDLRIETPEEYLKRVLDRLEVCSRFEPDSINSHTGKDHYSYEENCRIIEAIENFSASKGIPVYHEIHRGRFSFHSRSTLRYLEEFPEIKLVGDFSHWCVVSESLLQDQTEILNQVYPHIHHIHARIGTEQASQSSGAFAPEWKNHLDTFLTFWRNMVSAAEATGRNKITITPEFGPFPYMPETPYSREPLYDQHETNVKIKELLKDELTR